MRHPMDRFFSMYFFNMEEQGSKQERLAMTRLALNVGYFEVRALVVALVVVTVSYWRMT